MKTLLSKGLSGIAALLLAAAAIALLLFAFATLLGLASVLALAAAGVFIGAPTDAKALVRAVLAAVPKWLGQLEGIVANAGEMFLAGLGRGKSDAQKNHSASSSPEADAGSSRADEPSSSERAAASADAIRSD